MPITHENVVREYYEHNRGNDLESMKAYDRAKAKQKAKEEVKYEAKLKELELKKQQEQAELEAKMQFLKAHSNNPEDLEMAKMILGIK